MKLVDELLSELFAPNEENAKISLNQAIENNGLEGVQAINVAVEYGGDAVVTFLDDEGSEMDVLFTYDEDEGAVAIQLDDAQDYFDNEEDDIDMVDLDPLEPKLMDYGDGNIGFDLTDLGWMNADALIAILNIGDFLGDKDDSKSEVSEAMTTVIRNGKKVRVPLVRRRRRKRMTSKQKAAIRKGVRTRKKKRAQISRKLKKSLRVRRKLGVKRSSTRSHKVAGTSDRKR
jgi:hypothetical protein